MQSKERAILCAAYALEKKALNVRLIKVAGLSTLTDFLLIATGSSDRHVQSVAESVRMGMKTKHETQPLAVEGANEGRWVLLDYGDVMVHIFQEPVRHFYDLDGLWSEAEEITIPEEYHWEKKAGAR